MLLCACLLAATPALAERMLGEAEVERDGASYDVGMDVEIDLPRDSVFRIVTDFARIDRLSPAIVSARILSQRADGAEIEVVLNICPPWLRWLPGICRDFAQRQSMSLEAPARLELASPDEDPNLFAGTATWILASCPGREGCTAVRFDAELTARIPLPHVLLGGIVSRVLTGQAAELIRGIERVGASGDHELFAGRPTPSASLGSR